MIQKNRRGGEKPSTEPANTSSGVPPFDLLEAYVGYPASTTITNALLDLQRKLERRREEDDYEVRWVKATRMYVNLRQVGPLFPESLEPLQECLEERLADLSVIPTCIERLSLRPSREEPFAIWAELSAEDGAMEAVRARFEEVLEEFGVEFPEQGLEPHITLGLLERVGDVAVLEERLAQVPSNVTSGFRISTLHLRTRRPGHWGAEYETALRVDLPQPVPQPASQVVHAVVEDSPVEREPERPSVPSPNRESERPSVLSPNRESERPSILPRNRESERPSVLPRPDKPAEDSD